MGTTIITHADPDGMGAAATVKRAFPDARVVLMSYGSKLRSSDLAPGDTVFITDYSLPPKEMAHLASAYKLTWIDHHMETVPEVEAAVRGIPGVRSEENCACVLAWKYLFPNEPVPKVLTMIDQYERLWNPFPPQEAIEFDHVLRKMDLRPYNHNNTLWARLLNDDAVLLDDIARKGKELDEFVQLLNDIQVKDTAMEVILNGAHCIVSNAKNSGSLLFRSIAKPEDHDAVVPFAWRTKPPEAFKFSIFAIKGGFNVQPIAKSFNGGGHQGAAAWSSPSLPFELGRGMIGTQTYMNIWAPVEDYLSRSQLANMYLKREYQMAMMLSGFQAHWKDYVLFCVNYDIGMPEIFHEGEVHGSDVGCTFAWVGCGMFRLAMCPLKSSITLRDIAARVDGKIVGRMVWKYVRVLPFDLGLKPNL